MFCRPAYTNSAYDGAIPPSPVPEDLYKEGDLPACIAD